MFSKSSSWEKVWSWQYHTKYFIQHLELNSWRKPKASTPDCLCGILVAVNLPSLNVHLVIKPLAVNATRRATFGRTATWTGQETAGAVFVETVAQVQAGSDQKATFIIHFLPLREALPANTRVRARHPILFGKPNTGGTQIKKKSC